MKNEFVVVGNVYHLSHYFSIGEVVAIVEADEDGVLTCMNRVGHEQRLVWAELEPFKHEN